MQSCQGQRRRKPMLTVTEEQSIDGVMLEKRGLAGGNLKPVSEEEIELSWSVIWRIRKTRWTKHRGKSGDRFYGGAYDF